MLQTEQGIQRAIQKWMEPTKLDVPATDIERIGNFF